MRRFLLMGVVLVGLALLAGGCGEQAANDKPTILVTIPAADHGWTAGVGYWAEQAMARYPQINWIYKTAHGPDEQVNQIQTVMDQTRLDGIVILAHESGPLTPIAKKAAANGIYIVNVDRGFTEPVADVFLEGDNRAFGRKSAEYIAEEMLNGQGNVVILRGVPSTVDTDRFEAAMEVFNRYPDIHVLGEPQPANWQRDEALKVMQNYLTEFGDRIDVVWAADDDMALGAEQAIREAGLADRIRIFGGAGMKEIVKRVMENDPMYPADITYPPSMIAAGIHLAAHQLAGVPAEEVQQNLPPDIDLDVAEVMGGEMTAKPRHIQIDVQLITPENAETFYYPDSVY